MTLDGNEKGGYWYDAVDALRTHCVWNRPEELDDPAARLLGLAAVQAHLVGDSLEAQVDAIAAAVDVVLCSWKEAEERTPTTQSRFLAGAVLLRRQRLLPNDFLVDARRHVGLDDTGLAGAGVLKLCQAICRRWQVDKGRDLMGWRTFYQAHQHEVLEALTEALNPSGFVPIPGRTYPNSHYKPLTPSDADKGFWWRKPTDQYIHVIAGLDDLTIYAGADGFGDTGEPLHATLAQLFLTEWLKHNKVVQITGSRADLAKSIAKRFDGLSPSYIGSVIRGLTTHAGLEPDEVEDRLANIAERIIQPGSWDESRKRSGFVANSVAELAATIVATEGTVEVVSAHYDSDMSDALARLEVEDSVQLRSLHGVGAARTGAAVLSEADLFVASVPNLKPSRTWVEYFTQLLNEHPALFIGTEIRTPGLVAALAATRSVAHLRFALLLPSKQAPSTKLGSNGKSRTAKRRVLDSTAMYYQAVAGRYLDLGVTPIFLDFPYQVPQFLREVRRCRASGDGPYQGYSTRCDAWWDTTSALFAPTVSDPERSQQALALNRWGEALVAMRDSLRMLAPRGNGERLEVEAWLRNPQTRELFFWASSDASLKSDASKRFSLRATGVPQDAFREGAPKWGAPDGEPPWKDSMAVPLTLTDDTPYYGLPIGVLRVVSDELKGALRELKDEPAFVHQLASDVVRNLA